MVFSPQLKNIKKKFKFKSNGLSANKDNMMEVKDKVKKLTAALRGTTN